MDARYMYARCVEYTIVLESYQKWVADVFEINMSTIYVY